MSLAICINCGAKKKAPPQKCAKCGFVLRSDEDKAKSIILSLDYELDGEYKGKSKEELLEVARLVRNGTYRFDPDEVAEVVAYAKRTLSILPRKLVSDLIRWVALPIAILSGVFFLLWVTK
jgi:hypothetical protein